MAHLVQVGAGSGGMPVLDMLSRDPRVDHVTLIEPDIYKEHNVERHLFPHSVVGSSKAQAAQQWLKDRCPQLTIDVLEVDLLAEEAQPQIEAAVQSAHLGICAVDNEPAKYHWDRLMRAHDKPWTLGEVLSGGIGGFVHWFIPGGACYGCVASFLKRSVTVDKPEAPDYSQPGGAVHEVTLPASMTSIHAIASLHALVTQTLMDALSAEEPREQMAKLQSLGFTSLLLTLKQVPDIFEEAFKPHRFCIDRSPECLSCRAIVDVADEELDAALEKALNRLSDD